MAHLSKRRRVIALDVPGFDESASIAGRASADAPVRRPGP
jgi:hypothetical protein